MLFKKAASHYSLLEYDKAEHIIRELIKMDPNNELTVRFLKKCIYQNKPGYVKSTRAASVFLFLVTALLISVELLLIRPFYEMHEELIETTRNSIFLLGWIVLISGDLFRRYQVGYSVKKFVIEAKEQKQRNKARQEEMLV